MNHLKTIIRTVAVIVALVYIIILHAQLLRLTAEYGAMKAENVKFRVIKSTIDKMTYYKQPNIDDESDAILKASKAYITSPRYLTSLRQTENGRYLFEMGCQNIHLIVKQRFPNDVDNWQYYEASYLIAKKQRDFCMENVGKFTIFVAKTYPNKDHKIKKTWKNLLLCKYRKLKNAFKQ